MSKLLVQDIWKDKDVSAKLHQKFEKGGYISKESASEESTSDVENNMTITITEPSISYTAPPVVQQVVQPPPSVKDTLKAIDFLDERKRSVQADLINTMGLAEEYACQANTKTLPENLLASPYHDQLRKYKYKYVELNEQMCAQLNVGWILNQNLPFYTLQLFSGSILLNIQSNQSIMINSLEVYGRTNSVDAHSESFQPVKSQAVATSVLPQGSHYPGLFPITLSTADGQKLIMGTHISDLLVTSLTRLDIQSSTSVKAICRHFALPERSDDSMIHLNVEVSES
ncbi:hypothetical protein MBANPS3_001730 [Mucor bainieri]